jgi:hypothetical protein
MDADRVKHLELIQGIVNRLAGNSFSIKGWSITLVAALFALAAKDANPFYAAVALLPALFFWGLDAYYLRQERLYRGLYNLAVAGTVPAYSMDTSGVTVAGWTRVARSRTMLGFHLPVTLAAIAVLAFAALRPSPKPEPDGVAAFFERLGAGMNRAPDGTKTTPPASEPRLQR